MTVAVRRATRADAQVIANFAQKLVLQHKNYDANRFTQIADYEQMVWYYGSQTESKDSAVLVAEIANKVVGFAFVQFEAKNYAGLLESAAWVHDIYVDEAARGAEAGKNLINAAIDAAKELGANKLMLSAAAQNENAKGFFEHQGFTTTMVEMMLDLTKKEGND
jgi:GNAT superfamily N-acetyltransferase